MGLALGDCEQSGDVGGAFSGRFGVSYHAVPGCGSCSTDFCLVDGDELRFGRGDL